MQSRILTLSNSIESFYITLNQILNFSHQSFISNLTFSFPSQEKEEIQNQIQKIQHQICFLKDVSFDLKKSLAELHCRLLRRFYLN